MHTATKEPHTGFTHNTVDKELFSKTFLRNGCLKSLFADTKSRDEIVCGLDALQLSCERNRSTTHGHSFSWIFVCNIVNIYLFIYYLFIYYLLFIAY